MHPRGEGQNQAKRHKKRSLRPSAVKPYIATCGGSTQLTHTTGAETLGTR
jgi:hypothetical protein